MKILVISQYYPPEPFRIGDICEELVRSGHRVTVVTSRPNYPMGRIYPGYRGKQKSDETMGGVHVLRCGTIARRRWPVFRLLNYYGYRFFAYARLRRIKESFDVVLINGLSPVLQAIPGIRYARKKGLKSVLYSMDLWPASLAAGGIREGSLIYRHFERVSAFIYHRIDYILYSSRTARDYLTSQFGIPEDRLEYLPQHAEACFSELQDEKPDPGLTEFLFAGNVGAAQNVPVILKAAALLQSTDAPIQIRIVGDGSRSEAGRELARELGLNNVIFEGRHPAEEMPQYYARADAMLVTLSGETYCRLTLPGKVQSYFAAGKPVLGSADGETMDIIREAGCGDCVPSDDHIGLARIMLDFSVLPAGERARLGENARRYYQAHFTPERFYARLEAVLQTEADQSHA